MVPRAARGPPAPRSSSTSPRRRSRGVGAVPRGGLTGRERRPPRAPVRPPEPGDSGRPPRPAPLAAGRRGVGGRGDRDRASSPCSSQRRRGTTSRRRSAPLTRLSATADRVDTSTAHRRPRAVGRRVEARPALAQVEDEARKRQSARGHAADDSTNSRRGWRIWSGGGHRARTGRHDHRRMTPGTHEGRPVGRPSQRAGLGRPRVRRPEGPLRPPRPTVSRVGLR